MAQSETDSTTLSEQEPEQVEGIEDDVVVDEEAVVPVTPYLGINLDDERWVCRRCAETLDDAAENFKHGLLVNERDPGEIHRPLIGEEYEYTYKPDPEWCRILEYYCPGCGVQVETEYLPPGHPPQNEIQPDLEWLRDRYVEGEES
jgi:acetone carboxylase gamma subunit